MGHLVNQYYEFAITKKSTASVDQGLQKHYTRTEGVYTPFEHS